MTAGDTTTRGELVEQLLDEATPEPPAELLAALREPVDPSGVLGPAEMDRLLDPAPLAVENGWCWTPGHVGFVAVRTPMPGHTPEMWDWWFDWHPRASVRYRAWCPDAHFGIRWQPPREAGAKPFWGATHYPDEDAGTGREVLRIDFLPPSRYGFSGDALDDPRVGTIVGGYVGSPARHMRAGVMAHVLLRSDPTSPACSARPADGCSTARWCGGWPSRSGSPPRWPSIARESTRGSPRSSPGCTSAMRDRRGRGARR